MTDRAGQTKEEVCGYFVQMGKRRPDRDVAASRSHFAPLGVQCARGSTGTAKGPLEEVMFAMPSRYINSNTAT